MDQNQTILSSQAGTQQAGGSPADGSSGNSKTWENRVLHIIGMTCGSCERIITSSIEAAGGKVRSISAQNGVAAVEYAQGDYQKMAAAVSSAGYSLAETGNPAEVGRVGVSTHVTPVEDCCRPASRVSFESEMADFLGKLYAGDRTLWAERRILNMSVSSLLLVVFIGFFMYLISWRGIAGIEAKIPFMFYSALSAVTIAASVFHYQSHKAEFTCMEGMMVGMTIGMVTGLLFGAIVGATNGMFVGSVFGMAVGMLVGAWCGKCCGIMGVMEGMMAGLMGGTMGAMLTVMLQGDNLALFMPIFVASCLAILFGLTYMVYDSAGKRGEKEVIPFGKFFIIALLFAMVSVALILIGPRGPITV